MDKAPTEMFDVYTTACVAIMSGRNKRCSLIYEKIAKLTIKITLQTQYAIERSTIWITMATYFPTSSHTNQISRVLMNPFCVLQVYNRSTRVNRHLFSLLLIFFELWQYWYCTTWGIVYITSKTINDKDLECFLENDKTIDTTSHQRLQSIQ